MSELLASQVSSGFAPKVCIACGNKRNKSYFSSLCRQADLEARSVRVLVVSFGSVEGAQIWLEQTGCSFEMVLDPQRKVGTLKQKGVCRLSVTFIYSLSWKNGIHGK